MVCILLSLSILEGIPLSTTQAVVGAICGVAIVAGFIDSNWGFSAINYIELVGIFFGWIISPIIGFFAAATTHFWLKRLEEPALGLLNGDTTGMTNREQLDRIYAYLLGIFLIISTASRAGNDVANSIAPILSLQVLQEQQNLSIMMLIGGLGMASGLVLVGIKVIKVVAKEIVSMNTSSALSAMIAVTLVMTIGTITGFPLSGTHVLIFAMIAVGWAERSPIQRRMVRMILISWIITVPIAAVLGGIIWILVDFFFSILI
jgi:phosphate/sulfate permease